MNFDVRAYLIEQGGSAVASNGPGSLNDLRLYYEAVESFLAMSGEERQFRLRVMREKLQQNVVESNIAEEARLIWEDYFPSELRASVLLSLMSFFERYLSGVCSEVAILLKTQISHRKLKGSAIDRSQIFLTDVCLLQGPQKKRWQSMRRLQQLRNILIHNGGMLETNQELAKAQALVGKMEGAICHELGIDLEPEFIQYAFNEISQFMDDLSRALAQTCERVKKFDADV